MSDIEKYVEDAINGDSEAFARLYELSKRQVYFTCLKFLKNEDDAQDITQEVYITVMKKLPTLADKASFQPWVNRIAVNKCKNYLKARRDVSLDEMRDEGNYPEIPDDDLLPEDYVLNAAKRKIVMDIMESVLSDIQYQTVIMFYFNNLSVAEIAEITEAPVGTVTYRLNVARAKIKKGVLEYEEKNKDRLHAIVPILPFLTRLFNAEAESIEVPYLMPEISVAEAEIADAIADTASAADTVAKSTGFLSTVAGKVTAGVVALAVVGGGVGAGIAISNSNNTDIKTAVQSYIEEEQTEYTGIIESAVNIDDLAPSAPISQLSDNAELNIGDGYFTYAGESLSVLAEKINAVTGESYDFASKKYYSVNFYCSEEKIGITVYPDEQKVIISTRCAFSIPSSGITNSTTIEQLAEYAEYELINGGNWFVMKSAGFDTTGGISLQASSVNKLPKDDPLTYVKIVFTGVEK